MDLFIPCGAQLLGLWCQGKDSYTTQKPLCGDKEVTTTAVTALFRVVAFVEYKFVVKMNKGRGSGRVMADVVNSNTGARAAL